MERQAETGEKDTNSMKLRARQAMQRKGKRREQGGREKGLRKHTLLGSGGKSTRKDGVEGTTKRQTVREGVREIEGRSGKSKR